MAVIHTPTQLHGASVLDGNTMTVKDIDELTSQIDRIGREYSNDYHYRGSVLLKLFEKIFFNFPVSNVQNYYVFTNTEACDFVETLRDNDVFVTYKCLLNLQNDTRVELYVKNPIVDETIGEDHAMFKFEFILTDEGNSFCKDYKLKFKILSTGKYPRVILSWDFPFDKIEMGKDNPVLKLLAKLMTANQFMDKWYESEKRLQELEEHNNLRLEQRKVDIDNALDSICNTALNRLNKNKESDVITLQPTGIVPVKNPDEVLDENLKEFERQIDEYREEDMARIKSETPEKSGKFNIFTMLKNAFN